MDLKTALFCISFLRKGEVLAYVGRVHNLKDLKAGQLPPTLRTRIFFFFFITLGLELSDTKVYEP